MKPQNHIVRFSDQLDKKLSAYLVKRGGLWSALTASDKFRELYPHLLVQTYHYVKHSCPLMELALSSLNHPSYATVAHYLRHHISEENGHDEWLLSDLERLGYPKASAVCALPLRAIVAMVGSQLYIIKEIHPIGLLGYIVCFRE